MYKYLSLIGLMFLAGCGGDSGPKTVPAAGVVTIDGNPAQKATITFITGSGDLTATAMTDDQGKFSLRHNGEKDGAVPGSYKVQISKTVLTGKGESEITINHGLPVKYASIATSQLTETVPDSGKTDFKFELKSK